jgi:hypothetical protein
MKIFLSVGDRNLSRVVNVLSVLPKERPYVLEITEQKQTRSLEQNAYLWGVVYPTIMDTLQGWEAEDIHEFFLGEHFGWETIEGLGKKKLKPIKRSSKLSTKEFKDHWEFIQRYMSERGVYIPDPNEAKAA